MHPAIRRLVSEPVLGAALERLSGELPGSDARSFLSETIARRAARLAPGDVVAQYRRDRFVQPASVDAVAMAHARWRALEAAEGSEAVELAPLAPLGTHSVFARVDQWNVVGTARLSEVAADPTNQLALEVVARRRAVPPEQREPIRLAAVERVVRAQVFTEPRSFAHFVLFGVVAAERSSGAGVDGATHLDVIDVLVAVASEDGRRVRVALTDVDGTHATLLEQSVEQSRRRLADRPVVVEVDPRRESGRGYYADLCWKIEVDDRGEMVEIGDGGGVDWASTLLGDRRERLAIGGIGLDRLVAIRAATSGGAIQR